MCRPTYRVVADLLAGASTRLGRFRPRVPLAAESARLVKARPTIRELRTPSTRPTAARSRGRFGVLRCRDGLATNIASRTIKLHSSGQVAGLSSAGSSLAPAAVPVRSQRVRSPAEPSWARILTIIRRPGMCRVASGGLMRRGCPR